MLPFAGSWLAVFLLRAEIPAVGVWVASGCAAALACAALRLPAPRARPGRGAILAAILGGAAAWVPPPATDPAKGRIQIEAGETGIPARVTGVVERGGRVDPRGSWFRLRDGPAVRVLGARATPAPRTTVAVIGRLDAARATVVAAGPEAVSGVAESPPLAPSRFFESLRQLCRDRIHAACPPETAQVLLPLLIGDPGLPEGFRDELARTGTLHVIAVSGTHLSLFLAGLRIFTLRLRILVPMLVAYAGMCSFQPPVLRSLVLAVGFLCGRRLGRALPHGSHFLLSAVIVLAADPDSLFDTGFQLSFSAFGGIIAFARPPRRRGSVDETPPTDPWSALRRSLGPATRAGAGATLATAPAMIWRFNRISPVGVPATLILSPFIPVLLWLGALIVLFPSVPAFPRLASAITDLLVLVTSGIAALPCASIDVARPHVWALASFASVIVAIAVSKDARWTLVRALMVALGAFAVFLPDRAPAGLYQLPAGRGAATLLVTDGAAALVDVGPEASRVAEQVLKLGIRALDVVAVTHDHSDHAGGLSQVLQRLSVREIARGPSFGSDAPPGAMASARIWCAGASFDRGGLRLRVVWPPVGRAGDPNARSLVIAAEIAGLRALLCGDVDARGLAELLVGGPIGSADVVLLPHHGRQNDGLSELLLRTRPGTVVISNHAGGVAEETSLLLASLPIGVRATWREGTVTIPPPPPDP